MTWTHDAPTKPGWYWWRSGTTDLDFAQPRHLGFGAMDSYTKRLINKLRVSFPACQWSSTPIPEPKEAE